MEGGDEDAISCRLTMSDTSLRQCVFREVKIVGCTFVYGNGDLREGELRRGPGQGTGEGRESKRERKTE
jgi:hypothetical protein